MRQTARRCRGCGCSVTGGLAALLACMPLVGCVSSSSSRSADAVASAKQHPMLESFPIPTGFEPVPEHSYAMRSGEIRQATCEFTGRLGPAEVNRFYRETMPSAGFTLRQERMVSGEWVMEFDSAAERSTVRFRREKFKTILIIDVSPARKGSTERELTPPVRRSP